MLDLTAFDERRLAGALLREDHDLLTTEILDDNWLEGEVEEVQTESRDPSRWEISVSYRGICNDETSAFGAGTVVASDEVTPGEHDAYQQSVVFLFDELITGHHVILEGGHGGAGESDESHEAWMHGTITVVPESDGPDELRRAVQRQRREVLQDVRMEIDKQTRRLHDATRDELRENGVAEAFGALARQMAGAA